MNENRVDLVTFLYLVEILERYKKTKRRHFISFALIIIANSTLGVLLEMNTFIFFLESFVLGLAIGKYWKIKREDFLCEAKKLLSEKIDKTNVV